MQFGLNQIKKATPVFISNLKRAINTAIASIAILSSFLCDWWNITPDQLLHVLGFAGAFTNIIGVLFGATEGEPQRELNQPKE